MISVIPRGVVVLVAQRDVVKFSLLNNSRDSILWGQDDRKCPERPVLFAGSVLLMVKAQFPAVVYRRKEESPLWSKQRLRWRVVGRAERLFCVERKNSSGGSTGEPGAGCRRWAEMGRARWAGLCSRLTRAVKCVVRLFLEGREGKGREVRGKLGTDEERVGF